MDEDFLFAKFGRETGGVVEETRVPPQWVYLSLGQSLKDPAKDLQNPLEDGPDNPGRKDKGEKDRFQESQLASCFSWFVQGLPGLAGHIPGFFTIASMAWIIK
ncbi:MAG: hypothetical protein OXG96_14235 [Acidobacteria bacterium]|nr:hypothetical protein [Acidobacteriota bacterium]